MFPSGVHTNPKMNTYLWQYAGRSQEFDLQRFTSALTSALQAQKSFWKFCGIWMVISVVLLIVFVGIAIIGGIATSI